MRAETRIAYIDSRDRRQLPRTEEKGRHGSSITGRESRVSVNDLHDTYGTPLRDETLDTHGTRVTANSEYILIIRTIRCTAASGCHGRIHF